MALNQHWNVVHSAVDRIFADWKCRCSMARCCHVGLVKKQLHSRRSASISCFAIRIRPTT